MSIPTKFLQGKHDESESEDEEEIRTLFCRNLDEKVTEDLLYEVFIQAGPIDSVRIPKDHNGRQRTFGFITYVHKSTLPYAMELFQGLSLYRRSVIIQYQQNIQPSSCQNYNSPVCKNDRSNYDNSSIRVNSYSSHKEIPSQNPFRKIHSSDYNINSGKHQPDVLKHDSYQRIPQTNTSPYNDKRSPNANPNRKRDHNRRQNYNNGSNRHRDQRSDIHSPDYNINPGKHQPDVSKHGSYQRRTHTNASPYKRSPSADRNRERDHNRRQNYDNGSNPHRDQRSDGKSRR